MTPGLKAAEIAELGARLRALATRAERCRARAAAYQAAAAQAEREADAVQERLVRVARDSQYEVTTNVVGETRPAPQIDGSGTPPLPTKGAP